MADKWKKVGEDSSIVLIGSFNPSIFHPEWFIRHNIVDPWPYEANQSQSLATIKDLAQFDFKDHKKLQVMLNKFTLRTYRESEFLTLKDIVSETFLLLNETPVKQMGLNRVKVIQIQNKDLWSSFGKAFATHSPWLSSAPYISELPAEKQMELGLMNLTMQLPRNDELAGYIQATIKAENLQARTLSILINSHIEIEDNLATTAIDHLEDKWEETMHLSNGIIDRLIQTQVEQVE